MFQLIIIIFIVLIIISLRNIRREAPKKRAALILRYGLYAMALLLVGLVITGRVHWIAVAGAALLPILKPLFALALRFLPFIKKKTTTNGSKNDTNTNDSNQSVTNLMDTDQALKVFGFTAMETEERIVQRHRELIQKNHPDRGGSDFLAAQVNQAKTVLMDAAKNTS
ncbi:MAG: DnaJ family protein C protein 19 [Kiritimatiellia bacterium]|jgi:DnaJ family protein C protein 19